MKLAMMAPRCKHRTCYISFKPSAAGCQCPLGSECREGSRLGPASFHPGPTKMLESWKETHQL